MEVSIYLFPLVLWNCKYSTILICDNIIIKSYSNPFTAYNFITFLTGKNILPCSNRANIFPRTWNPCWCLWLAQLICITKFMTWLFVSKSLYAYNKLCYLILESFFYRQKTKYTFYIILLFCSKTDKILRGYIFHLEQVIFKFMLIRFIFRMRIQKALKLADHRTPKTIN